MEPNQTINPKIITSADAHNFLIQNIELKPLKKKDCFFAIYLNENNEVLHIKTIEKKKAESDLEIVGQILDFDKNLNVNSLIVFHKPVKNKGVLSEIPIANVLIDKSFFACVDILDYQWLFHEKHYHSMFDHKNVDFGKYSYQKKRTIKKNEQYSSSTNLQDLFDMDVNKLKKIIELEFDKISVIDSFVCWEIIDNDLKRYTDMRFKSVFPWDIKEPLSKIYLITVFNDYMKAKNRLLSFVIESNRYEKYLLYRCNYDEYHRLREQKEAAKNTRIMQVKWHNSINVIKFQTTTLLSLQV